MTEPICPGFEAAGVAAGLKPGGRKDLGLIHATEPATVAGVFTRNRVQAAPVLLCRDRLDGGLFRAVIANSKNANCCTGARGLADAESVTGSVAGRLGIPSGQVFAASTGVIGEPLPVSKIEAALPGLVDALSPEGFDDFAEAIMTTDTVPKRLTRTGSVEGRPFTITVVAKGAGMIRPDVATMLCFVCTDVRGSRDRLQKYLAACADRSFNRISVDGDTSTNDTVLLMASGCSGVDVDLPEPGAVFERLLGDILIDMAKWLVRDGEGVTKMVDVVVRGAGSDEDARALADTVAHSPLVKTAFFGEDANWGRILAAAGRAGVPFDPDRIDIYFNDVQMVRDGIGCGKAAEARATEVLRLSEFSVTLDLKSGDGSFSMLTCDFSVDYVKINADYRS